MDTPTIQTGNDTELAVSNSQTETANVAVSDVSESAPKPARKTAARKPAIRKPADALNVARRFSDVFPGIAMPGWCEPMVSAFRTIHATLKPADRAKYDAVLTVATRVITRPADGSHAFTLGGVSDIAKTQNAIYVALAVSGIPRADIPDEYGAALWTAVIGPAGPKTHRCEYRDHVEYFDSTLSRLVADDHNLTPGIPRALVAAVVTAWRKPAKS